MEAFTIVDGIVAAVIILSAILAYARGFVRESLAILGWVGAAVLAYILAPLIRPMITQIPYLDRVLQNNCQMGMLASFAIVLAIMLVVFSIITPLFSSVVQRSALGGVDQGMGFLFGVARGVLLCLVAFIIYDLVSAGQRIAQIDDSRSASIFSRMGADIGSDMPNTFPDWVEGRYGAMTRDCNGLDVAAVRATDLPRA